MAVNDSRCIARGLLRARPAGCRWAALWLAPASPRPDSKSRARGVDSFGVQVRCRAAPGAMGLDLPFLGPTGYGRGTYTLARRRAKSKGAVRVPRRTRWN